MAHSTAATLLADVRLRVESSEPRLRPYQTTVTNAAGTGTTISVGDGDAWQAGDLLEGPLGEMSLVLSKSTNDLTVRRTVGATSVETLASGDVVRKNPRFSADQINAEVLVSLRSLRGNGLYKIDTEEVTYTTADWYDVTDTDMEKVISAYYIDSESDFRVPFFRFATDPQNGQPKVWLSASNFSGAVVIQYRIPYNTVGSLSDTVADLLVYETIYKLMGQANIGSTADPGRRTDRTVQGGQEGRDSIWYLREFIRLRDLEVARLHSLERQTPRHPTAARAARYVT